MFAAEKPKRAGGAAAEVVGVKAIRAGIGHGAQDGAAHEADEDEIVEMPGLKGGVLAVVGEAENLALFGGDGLVGGVQPLKQGGCDGGGGR
ncbi:MAG: hypothetical protein V9G19_08610 [Tetrasphaera sp.]